MSGVLTAALCLITYLNTFHSPTSGTMLQQPQELKHRHKTWLTVLKRHVIRTPEHDADNKDDTMGKRQDLYFDDYGHMRFGKREDSDDYGHLRFGRAGE